MNKLRDAREKSKFTLALLAYRAIELEISKNLRTLPANQPRKVDRYDVTSIDTELT